MTKPKIFDDKAMYVRMYPGVRERMERLRGKQRIGDFARELLEEALEARERRAKRAGSGLSEKPSPKTRKGS